MVGPQGQRRLLPTKNNGMILMLSAIQLHETGFGIYFSRIQLEEINDGHQQGQSSIDLDAAIGTIHGQVGKEEDLKESPFVVSVQWAWIRGK